MQHGACTNSLANYSYKFMPNLVGKMGDLELDVMYNDSTITLELSVNFDERGGTSIGLESD